MPCVCLMTYQKHIRRINDHTVSEKYTYSCENQLVLLCLILVKNHRYISMRSHSSVPFSSYTKYEWQDECHERYGSKETYTHTHIGIKTRTARHAFLYSITYHYTYLPNNVNHHDCDVLSVSCRLNEDCWMDANPPSFTVFFRSTYVFLVLLSTNTSQKEQTQQRRNEREEDKRKEERRGRARARACVRKRVR